MKDSVGISENKRGYLKEDFRFFHLKDRKNMQFEYHHHDFNKIVVFLSGNVTYLVEGKAYKLKPWDIILVSNKELHKPVIEPNKIYERIILWVNPAFLEKHSDNESNLLTCFDLALDRSYNLLRLSPQLIDRIKYILFELEKSCKSKEFGSRILQNSLLMQFIVQINREFPRSQMTRQPSDIIYDKQIGAVITYINENLADDLSIDHLSSMFFISKYHLMHKFKMQTGYSIHQYILQKRLIKANTLIQSGKPATEVSIECGFGDYSCFVRAFKKLFGLSPKKYYKSLMQGSENRDRQKHF